MPSSKDYTVDVLLRPYRGYDNVDKPVHYASTNIETIDYIKDKLSQEAFEGFTIGNVIKYISRYKLKNGLEDLKKAKFYLDYIIKDLEGR